MINIEEQYIGLLSGVFHGGLHREARNCDTSSVFGRQIRHDMSLGFPLLNTKRIWFNGIVTELLWMLQGRTDIQYLRDGGIKYWDLNYEQSGRTDGDLGKVYGYQWHRNNQLNDVLEEAKRNPNSRRLIVDGWNHGDLDDAALPPCHYGFQLYMQDGVLSLMWNQRSVDLFLGLPFDIGLYGLLLTMIADELGLEKGQLIGNLGDCHIYSIHRAAVEEQLLRSLSPDLPVVTTKGLSYNRKDIVITGYNPQSEIKADMV